MCEKSAGAHIVPLGSRLVLRPRVKLQPKQLTFMAMKEMRVTEMKSMQRKAKGKPKAKAKLTAMPKAKLGAKPMVLAAALHKAACQKKMPEVDRSWQTAHLHVPPDMTMGYFLEASLNHPAVADGCLHSKVLSRFFKMKARAVFKQIVHFAHSRMMTAEEMTIRRQALATRQAV